MRAERSASGTMTQAAARHARFRPALAILILVAFALRMVRLGAEAFWLDEATSAVISSMGWMEMLAYLRTAPWEHPPLYYLSLYLWQGVAGDSEFALRFYSVFWGLLFISLLFALVRRWTDESLAFLVALLAAVSPYLVAYSQEARMYTLFPTLALLAILAFWNAVQRRVWSGWWIAYVVLMAGGLMTHYYFGLVWVVTTLYLVVEFWRHRRLEWWAVGAQGVFVAVGLVWVLLAPGLRESLFGVGRGADSFGLLYKIETIMPALMLSEIDNAQISPFVHVLAVCAWALVVYGVVAAVRSGQLTRRVSMLLILLLIVPLAGSLVLVLPRARHLGFVLIPGLTFMAWGLVALRRRGRAALVVGIVAFLLPSTYGLVVHYRSSNGNFDQAMAYIDASAAPGDAVVLSQPDQWPLAEYYNKNRLPLTYYPTSASRPTESELDEALGALSRQYDRLWLGPAGAWTVDPDLLVDRWLARRAFQAEKVWFPDSSSVSLYLTGGDPLMETGSTGAVWGGSIRLAGFFASAFEGAPGDAIRLRLQWMAEADLGQRYEVSLLLVDEQGEVWAERRSEPCAGWCPTDGWTAGQLIDDLHGLVIPPGTPPGEYHLEATWTALDGGTALLREENGQRVKAASLARVEVLPGRAARSVPDGLPNDCRVTFGDEMVLRGYDLRDTPVRVGDELHLETHWLATGAPAKDYGLSVELVQEDQVFASWTVPPVVSHYPTSAWRRGEYLRGKHDLPLPVTLAPGRYQLQVGLTSPSGELLPVGGEVPRPVLGGFLSWKTRPSGLRLAVGPVVVTDRPRRFDLPYVENIVYARVGRNARLVGYDLDASRALPGETVRITAVWQADGPMTAPYKVFVHLVDEEGVIRTQHDGYPGGGCCPANTWAAHEVIVDEHPLALGADLAAGTYQIVIGMYDEATAFRLPAYVSGGEQLADDQIPVGELIVEPLPVTPQATAALTETRPGTLHSIFVPLVTKRTVPGVE